MLRDVDELTYREIGEELGVDPPANFDIKGDHPTVRQMVSRGRIFLERTLSKQGWNEQVQHMKNEAVSWHSLGAVEKKAKHLFEHWGYPFERALQIARENPSPVDDSDLHTNPEND